jgi:ABC-type ATPase with predicted acetyltransferase domain
LIKSVLQTHEFEQTEGHDWNILWTNTVGKPYLYTGLNEYQKVNHFPSSYEITRKNNLATNILIMQNKFGKKEYGIIPETYVLPKEFGDFFN